ncbi:3 beta-hydroxysteroid dehydrogenase/Delta 5--_4-isomerase [Caulifigura coniformis]|uniref:3 beta-hydroxysteroid dehydrogenase/Delta 5-->4-isomerase n=1 Tax=Caulifigura coniformis TaxID=2527983 RepID=A0A517SCZ9_9PLAN|nr:NAD-dependent epimerase/dehydratase family protein [Caulifigura coniformis]QDT53998.1 3 beta-hydroxysteroid dehydrogenase/Delta 5-->4-isomerase [Caulifigura coniformis]
MLLLVTGGTGVVGRGVIPELLAAGHQVRLLSRHAEEQAAEWPAGVECLNGDVTDPASLDEAARGCDVVIHVTGIVDEKPPEITFERVNVEGTRHVLEASSRAGVKRFVFISSLGADRGTSPYHRSKIEAEQLVSRFPREWVILRPGHVFGPGDEMISMVLKMVRTSPVVPEIGLGQHRFQPLWFKDFGKAVAKCVTRPELSRQILEVAGAEVITVSELLHTLSELTDRPALPLPLPAFLVKSTLWAFERGRRFLPGQAELPLNESKLTMLVEENMIAEGGPNALVDTLGIPPTPLADALRELADTLLENPLHTGVGRLEHKQFWIDLADAAVDAEGLMTLFKTRINEVMPIDFSAEPGAPQQVENGATLCAHLPGRGNIQVRVHQCDPDRVTFTTVEGHPLAGVVSFFAEGRSPGLRFTVETMARPANTLDWIAINLAGRWFQDLTWQNVAARMGELSGGQSPDGVQTKARTVEGEEARQIEQWADDFIATRRREKMEEEIALKN